MVKSSEELQKVLKLGNTFYLRKNIQQVEVTNGMTGETRQEWQADEVSFEHPELEKEKVLNNFEIYWNWAISKNESEKNKKEKEKLVRKLIDKEYDLADLKEIIDQLVIDKLEV